jgi:hypothetical protein
MGMSSWIMDRVDEFYKIAQTKIGECESCNEFIFAMKGHEHMLLGSKELEYVQEGGYHEMWSDFWSDYQQ